jgi:hypothetical protein
MISKKLIPLCILALFLGCGRTSEPDNRGPNKPHDPVPLDGSDDQPVNDILRWTGGDPDGDPVVYDVFFGVDPSPPLMGNDVSVPEYYPGLLDTFSTYYWRVVARDANGVETAGRIWRFKTGNNPPFVPGNPDPPDSALDQSIFSTLSWTGGDPDGDTLTYYLYFGESLTPPWILTTGLTSYDPGVLAYLTTYYWKVVARDQHNNIVESPLWSFTTWDTLPNPQNVTLLSDAEGDGVVLSWDLASNVEGYEVTTPGHDTILLNADETSYTDDFPPETGTYTVCTFRGTEKSRTVSRSSAPFDGTFAVVLYVWSDPVQPAGFGWDPAVGSGSVYDCIDEHKDSVDFYLNDSTALFDFTSGDQAPYLGYKTTGILSMGFENFFEAPLVGYISSIMVQEDGYYAMNVEGDYYAKVRVLNVVSGVSASFFFEFQKIQHLRIF